MAFSVNVVDFDYQSRPARRWDWLLAFGLAAVLFFAAGIVAQANPLTGGSWLGGDLSQQYVSFFQYYRHVWAGATDQIGYSFANGLGGSMAGNWAYYLLSPFNLLTLLFPASQIPLALYVLVWLKISCAAAAMSFMLRKVEPTLERTINLALAISYAMMGYAIVYQMNLMWLDGVILLPLLVWALRRLLDQRSYVPYTLLLALAVISNYYIAYMLAAFLVLYCLYMVIMSWADWRKAGKQIVRFVWGSLLGGLLSMVVVVPTLLDLLAGKGTQATPHLPLIMQGWTLVPTKLILGSPSNGLPNVFIGTLAMFAFVGYFFSTRFALREKIAGGLVALILASGFLFNVVNLFWHGMQLPQAYPFRFSFLVSFWLIYLAATQLTQIDYWHFESWFPSTLVGVAVLGYAFLMRHRVVGITWSRLLLSAFFFLLIMATVVLWEKRSERLWRWLVLLAVVGEFGANAALVARQMVRVPTATYTEYYQRTHQWVQTVQKQDDTAFYRLDKNFVRANDRGDAFGQDYASASVFTSNTQPAIAKFYTAMGLPAYGYWAAYTNGTRLTDTFLGIKYFATTTQQTTPAANFTNYGQRNDLATLPITTQQSKVTVRENTDALPLGFAVPSNMVTPTYQTLDILGNQNNLFNALTGADDAYFTPLTATAPKLTNAVLTKSLTGTTITKKNPAKPAQAVFTIAAPRQLPTYITIDQGLLNTARVTLNGQAITFFPAQYAPVPLGTLPRHGRVTLTLNLLSNKIQYQAMQIDQLHPNILQEAATKLKQQSWRLRKVKANELAGSITTTRDQQLLTTIPYSRRGWTATVDGKPAAIKQALNTFISVPLKAGQHQVVLRYRIPGMRLGIGLSIAGLVLLIGTLIIIRRKRPADGDDEIQ
ncbi:YfhO family protein [Schleiferilactobacillus harbinensis]|uniref:YfhO family protein n=1 Tax=Schleiferilactobacillus harbinensis TaxID=304207 RepID=UPI0009E1C92D|nr:YfhO family protein [Schleiferilactobacillus harbinensis]